MTPNPQIPAGEDCMLVDTSQAKAVQAAKAAQAGNYTPGPWKSSFKQIGLVTAENGAEIAKCKRLTSLVNLQANAWLIAAVPDLLAALQLAVRQNSHDMLMTGEELRQCEAAIAKATGVQA